MKKLLLKFILIQSTTSWMVGHNNIPTSISDKLANIVLALVNPVK